MTAATISLPHGLYRCGLCQGVMTETDMTTSERCRWCMPGYLCRHELIEDVEWMLVCGEHPSRICARLGMSAAAVERRMYRAGRPDLARHFHAEIWARAGGTYRNEGDGR